jgi:phage FluMu gp28-like protein
MGLNSTLIAGAQKVAGGDNVYYIGDTKEKGLEFIGYVAKFARVIAAQQARTSQRLKSSCSKTRRTG